MVVYGYSTDALVNDLTHWRFYANDVYLNVTFMRDQKKMDPNQPAAYLITINLKGANAVQRTYFKEHDRPLYKELYPAERKRLAKMRGAAEDKVKSKYHIDETYVDPDGTTLPPGWIRQGEIN